MLDKLVDYWWYYACNLRRHEKKLLKYQGYGERTILDFKRNNNLDWKLVKIIVDNITIMDGLELRHRLRDFVETHKDLFHDKNTFFTHFGPAGKSGSVILNQFRHSMPSAHSRIINNDKLNQLPDNSNIIFLDDFIGTGEQASGYIYPVTMTINTSVRPFLFTLCATDIGLLKIQEQRSKFRVFSSIILEERNHFLLEDICNKLDENQKSYIRNINNKILYPGDHEYNLNIPFGFYYSIPDNALPLLWKDNVEYSDDNGNRKNWFGLTPRNY